MMPRHHSLAQIFGFRGRIGHFNGFTVFGAVYFDESGNDDRSGRIAVAASIASVEGWEQFETKWSHILGRAGNEFHAKDRSTTQYRLNCLLPVLMELCGVVTLCITLDRQEYRTLTSADDRSRLGNVAGFAGFLCIGRMAQYLRDEKLGDIGYYVEQGGPGFDKMMEFLGMVYRLDEARTNWHLADYGPVDRRIHLPVHASDLIAHETITNRDKSEPLKIAGNQACIIDLGAEYVQSAVEIHRTLWKRYRRESERKRHTRKLSRKSGKLK